MSLGYGNFVAIVQYDIFAMAMSYLSSAKSWSMDDFYKSDYGLKLTSFESSSIRNSPNLSIFPLLAYHKICNDHYRNEKWQSFQPWTCNIDYLDPTSNMNANVFISKSTFTSMLTSILDLENSNLPIDYLLPTDNMNAKSFIKSSAFTSLMTSIIDLENSNLPIDYFTSVLPRAQYGDESAVTVSMNAADATYIVNDASKPSKGVLFGGSSYMSGDTLVRANTAPTAAQVS